MRLRTKLQNFETVSIKISATISKAKTILQILATALLT